MTHATHARFAERRCCLVMAAAGMLGIQARAADKGSLLPEVLLYTYHRKPPYLTDLVRHEGLYFDLAKLLDQHAPALRFRVEYLPRRRLEAGLSTQRLGGLVLGVHPSWFQDSERKLHLWSPAFMSDADIVVSPRARPVSYDGPESLVNLRVALPRGYYYAGVSEMSDMGRIWRIDSESEETALTMLSLGRADASIITRRTLEALLAQRPSLRERLHVAARPHAEFDLHLLVPRNLAALFKPVSDAVSLAARDPAWLARLS